MEAEKCLQSSLEVRGVGDGGRGQGIANLMDDIFSAEEWEPEPEQLYPASLCGSACTYAIPQAGMIRFQ